MLVAAIAVLACSCGGNDDETPSWASPNGDLASTRSNEGSAITAASVDRLRVAWRFRIRAKGGDYGLLSSTPLTRGGVAYVQDTSSSVYAIELQSGRGEFPSQLAPALVELMGCCALEGKDRLLLVADCEDRAHDSIARAGA